MGKIFSQLISAQLENRTSDYSSGTRGRIWMRTDTSPVVAKFDDGSAIRTLVTTDNTQTLTNKTLTSPTLTTPTVDIPLLSHQTTPSSPSSGYVKLYFKNDDTLYYKNSGGTETTVATTATAAPDQSYELSNVSIATSVAASALTISLKGKDGNDPSGSNIFAVGFRNSTVTTGTYVRRTLTTSSSIVVPSTATLGLNGSSVAQYVYVYVIDNAGTIEPAVSATLFDEGSVQTSTSISTSADSATVLYSTTGRTSKAIRLIGRIKFTLAVAGTWDEAGDEVSLAPFDNRKLTPWTSFTMTVTGTSSDPTKGTVATDSAWWRRVGDSMEIRWDYRQTGAGSAGSGGYLLALPSGYTINTDIVSAVASSVGQYTSVGSGFASINSAGVGTGSVPVNVAVYDSTHLDLYFSSVSGTALQYTYTVVGSSLGFDNAQYLISFRATVPIVGWDA